MLFCADAAAYDPTTAPEGATVKIALRGSGSRRLVRKLERSGVIDLVGGSHGEMFFDSSWPNPKLEEFLRAAAKQGAFDINPWMVFTPAEIAKAEFLRLHPRKVVNDSVADYEQLCAHTDSLSWIGDDPKFRCRLPERLNLSKIRLQPNHVAVVGQWTAEFVVPQAVRSIFEAANLTGIEFRPIFHTRTGEAFEDFFHLYANHLLARRELDLASPEIRSSHVEEQGYDAMGCLCYDRGTLNDAPDFSRTGEGNVGFQFPDWIVRSRVRKVFKENLLKGWAFEPALELGTPLHEKYDDLWSSFYRVLADCRKHTVRCHPIASLRPA